mgnify:CR=1 FL=1
MKIGVSGLGIIGASLCASLKKAGYKVYGKNRSSEPLEYAFSHGMIDKAVQTYDDADIVFLALPPAVTVQELEGGVFKKGAIVADICGVKSVLEEVVYAKPHNYRYVGTHPMAGKETSGIRSASATLFSGANLIVTVCDQTDPAALAQIERLGKEMGFGRIERCSARTHDEKIAITSQLAHIVANAYGKSERAKDCAGFTGGSFQDMTRIAGVDEEMWSQLYLYNREPLLQETEGLISRLNEYRDALANGDGDKMRELLKEGRLAHEIYRKKK